MMDGGDNNNKSGETTARAIEQFLLASGQAIKERNDSEATSHLKSAKKKILMLNPNEQQKYKNEVEALETRIKLRDLYPRQPQPFQFRFKVLHRSNGIDELAYNCFYDMCRLIREKVFCSEQHFPEFIEFDDHEEKAFHALVLKGDAPYTYARLRIQEGQNKVNWAVLDRLCTLGSPEKGDNNQPPPYDHRGNKAATYMLNCLVEFIRVRLLRTDNADLHPRVLVAKIPVRLADIVDHLYRKKGFHFVTDIEDYRNLLIKAKNEQTKPPLAYFDEGRVRLNTVQLYYVVPVDHPQQARDELSQNGNVVDQNSPDFTAYVRNLEENYKAHVQQDLLEIRRMAQIEMQKAANQQMIDQAKDAILHYQNQKSYPNHQQQFLQQQMMQQQQQAMQQQQQQQQAMQQQHQPPPPPN